MKYTCERNQMNAAELTTLLREHTNLLSLILDVNQGTGECHLTLNLSQDHQPMGGKISIEFIGVSELLVDRVGGGLIQLLMLSIEDIQVQQLDRLNYRVYSLENTSLSFACKKWVVHKIE